MGKAKFSEYRKNNYLLLTLHKLNFSRVLRKVEGIIFHCNPFKLDSPTPLIFCPENALKCAIAVSYKIHARGLNFFIFFQANHDKLVSSGINNIINECLE